ncbi:MAG: NADP-dependent isocitrate dehydrogenase, partial [Thermoanaerobaculia bacterium]
MTSQNLTPPADGQEIKWEEGNLVIPDHPIIPFIDGDGIGPDIWRATKLVLDSAVERAYKGDRSIAWLEILA